MKLRWMRDTDAAPLADVFYRAVREGPSPYSEEQRQAWMAALPEEERFAQRLASYFVAVACENGTPVGFIAANAEGYVDLAFILPQARHRGLFRKLYAMIESRLLLSEVTRVWTHASLTAEPAFAAVGFSVIQRETVERAGVGLQRAEMEKHLK
ncbi:MAG: GNAT family N-acetyltransferase [Pseudomonadota bacterium]